MAFQELNGSLYFRALDNYDEYYQLWKSDGTAAGTKKLSPDPQNLFNYAIAQLPYFTVLGDKLFFRAQYDEKGYELWTIAADDAMAVTDVNKNKFTVYPNPAVDVINISGDKEITSVQVYDYSGKSLLSSPANSKKLQLDVSSLSKGNYVVKVLSEQKSTSYKIIKN